MYGRYGADELYNFLFILYIFLLIVDLFFRFEFLVYFELFLIIIILYRFFSKDIAKRSKENKIFLKLKLNITKPFFGWMKKIKDSNNIYKKCRKCQTTLRLPVVDRRGFRYVKCPKCKRRFRVLCLKKEKVEVIK